MHRVDVPDVPRELGNHGHPKSGITSDSVYRRAAAFPSVVPLLEVAEANSQECSLQLVQS